MVNAIRVHRPGGPEVLSLGGGRSRPAGHGRGRGSARPRSASTTSTPITAAALPDAAARRLGHGGGRRGRGGRAGGRRRRGRRPRRLCRRPLGAYAEARVMPADRLVPVPDGIDDRPAAAMMLQGHDGVVPDPPHLPREARRDDPDPCRGRRRRADRLPMGKALGATVIGTVGADEKARARQGERLRPPDQLPERGFRRPGQRDHRRQEVPVVYDPVGKDTFYKSLDCLRAAGLMALFGQSSGSVPPFDLGILAGKGSLFVTRPTLKHLHRQARRPAEASAKELFDVVEQGRVKIAINQTYPLRDAAQAHRDLQAARRTTARRCSSRESQRRPSRESRGPPMFHVNRDAEPAETSPSPNPSALKGGG